MIAVDTNILVYAHMNQTQWHASARECIERLWSGDGPWMIPWPCVHEFYAVVTNRNAYKPAATPRQAAQQIDAWFESDSLIVAGEGLSHWPKLRELIDDVQFTGSKVHDAKIAAICLQAGVSTLWTADRDYSRFPDLHCENPLVRRK